jgi:hypothetical protein
MARLLRRAINLVRTGTYGLDLYHKAIKLSGFNDVLSRH